MKRLVLLLCLLVALTLPVGAAEYTAPEAPDSALALMPTEQSSFGEDLWTVICAAVEKLQPSLAEAARLCVSLFSTAMLISVIKTLPGRTAELTEFVGVIGIALLMAGQAGSMITLAADTVTELSEYGKLLLPVLSAALAAQGGITASTALYTGTALFNAVLSSAISGLLIPMVYVFLALCVGAAATGDGLLEKLRDLVSWLAAWMLRSVLYVFTGYMGITGVVSGTTDAATLKAAKLTIASAVPVVGGILSDASEAVLAGVDVMRGAVGAYGLVALLAIVITPFFRIGLQYLLLKLTAALCRMFSLARINALIDGYTAAMGLLLGMTGSVCVLFLISTVCFMKGVS